jgi:cellobiose transport system substrate-binding protein
MAGFSRRSLLAGAAGLGAMAAAGGLSGCGSPTSISSDPKELVLWHWNRSADPSILDQLRGGIPGTDGYRLRSDVIGGTWDTKLRTSLAGNAYIPDLTYINSNVALYFPSEEMFIDLNDLGAEEYREQYFDWKWQLGVTPTNAFRFFPLDTGPTGYYYRTDVLEKAKMDPDPAAVSEQMKTWDGFIEFGQKLKTNADVFTEVTGGVVFAQFINASPERYFDKAGKPLYMTEGNFIRQAWDVAVKAINAGILGNQQNDTDKNAAWNSGKTAGHIEAVWWAQVLADTAPDTKGMWRIASQPVRPGNSGGSFVALPHTCKNPEAAFKAITFINNAENQATAFNNMQLFPSAIESFELGTMKSENDFFGDQDSTQFFLEAAQAVPTSFISTYETQAQYFGAEITNVESAGKDPEQAWDDAVAQTNRTLRKRGVEV